ncbi:hybrid sensor histidine kinase/response regulator [Candidatus Parabeggiatoa sp. HSG14]|uniref:hybrid sensor histidine kinase/response regulator n=1 Tax=Candidatus Parabeggiatoa sp. HSG14 TaxID=3055593 RepID=UPI0025A7DC15|nr:hybrid sensor histidine kinase/response regulator [Thiotrichales bacterium HSG14]
MKRKQTILFVDDNPKNLGILGTVLAESEHSLYFAKNGALALDITKNKHPDLILLDIMMPDMDGFEVCRRLKQDPLLAEIPIIFLTAKTEKDDVITGLKLGAVDYVTKPFNKKELLTRVNTHLELRAAKEELQESLAEKEEALATKDKLFSIIGHDLGNIIYGLKGFAELLTDEEIQPDVEERKDYLQMLNRAATDGYDLLTNLLNWSRSQTGRLQANPTTLILQDSIYQNVNLQQDKAQRKKINILAGVNKNITVFTDENMLDTVLRNLISNAIKFTPKSGTIRITAEPIDDNVVEISITDTGIGIKSENINQLFRVNIANTYGTDGEKGNGLGLVLCKELIEKCNGTIGVESEVGEGSRFSIRIPINA